MMMNNEAQMCDGSCANPEGVLIRDEMCVETTKNKSMDHDVMDAC